METDSRSVQKRRYDALAAEGERMRKQIEWFRKFELDVIEAWHALDDEEILEVPHLEEVIGDQPKTTRPPRGPF